MKIQCIGKNIGLLRSARMVYDVTAGEGPKGAAEGGREGTRNMSLLEARRAVLAEAMKHRDDTVIFALLQNAVAKDRASIEDQKATTIALIDALKDKGINKFGEQVKNLVGYMEKPKGEKPKATEDAINLTPRTPIGLETKMADLKNIQETIAQLWPILNKAKSDKAEFDDKVNQQDGVIKEAIANRDGILLRISLVSKMVDSTEKRGALKELEIELAKYNLEIETAKSARDGYAEKRDAASVKLENTEKALAILEPQAKDLDRAIRMQQFDPTVVREIGKEEYKRMKEEEDGIVRKSANPGIDEKPLNDGSSDDSSKMASN